MRHHPSRLKAVKLYYDIKKETELNNWFSFVSNESSLKECFICYTREKSKNSNFLRYFHTWWLYSRKKKQNTLQLLVITENTRNKQTIKEKDKRKNIKVIDPEIK